MNVQDLIAISCKKSDTIDEFKSSDKPATFCSANRNLESISAVHCKECLDQIIDINLDYRNNGPIYTAGVLT